MLGMGCWCGTATTVVMCQTRQQAEAALERLTVLLAELGLEPQRPDPDRASDRGGEGLDFLGFHHRWVRAEGRTSGKGVCFLAHWPSHKAIQHARDRIREVTDRKQLLLAEMDRGGTLNWFPRPARRDLSGTRNSTTALIRSASTPWNGSRVIGKHHERSTSWA